MDLRDEGPSPEPPSLGAPEGGFTGGLRLLEAAQRSLGSDPSRPLELLEATRFLERREYLVIDQWFSVRIECGGAPATYPFA